MWQRLLHIPGESFRTFLRNIVSQKKYAHGQKLALPKNPATENWKRSCGCGKVCQEPAVSYSWLFYPFVPKKHSVGTKILNSDRQTERNTHRQRETTNRQQNTKKWSLWATEVSRHFLEMAWRRGKHLETKARIQVGQQDQKKKPAWLPFAHNFPVLRYKTGGKSQVNGLIIHASLKYLIETQSATTKRPLSEHF